MSFASTRLRIAVNVPPVLLPKMSPRKPIVHSQRSLAVQRQARRSLILVTNVPTVGQGLWRPKVSSMRRSRSSATLTPGDARTESEVGRATPARFCGPVLAPHWKGCWCYTVTSVFSEVWAGRSSSLAPVRLAWAKPRPTSTAMTPARQNAAIAHHSAIEAIRLKP